MMVYFTGGTYNIRSIDTRNNTRLRFENASNVRVVERFNANKGSYSFPTSQSKVTSKILEKAINSI